RGRTLGFATANCGTPENQVPAGGVYAARVWIDGRGPWPAAVNAGYVPTVAGERPFTVEAHLIGFSEACYGARIEIDLLARLREERRFPDLAALVAQIRADVARAGEVAA
ncbi:MAG: riboflavin kinase, partial [Planctomycetes bacterium]|nr:riboflavin kinase [Planctomycetota bacterium]